MSISLQKSERLLKNNEFEVFLQHHCILEDMNIKLIKGFTETVGKRNPRKRLTRMSNISAVSVLSSQQSLTRKSSLMPRPSSPSSPCTNRTKSSANDVDFHHDIYCYFNVHGQLMKIEMKNINIPTKLMDILKQCIRFFNALTSITIKSCRTKSIILLQLNHILLNTNVSELILDNTVIDYKNYYILLGAKSQLKLLSLSRCSIDDYVCKEIVDRLVNDQPMCDDHNLLCVLDLSSNLITDIGAKSIANMLRTNRQLVHLNLAGNQITDEGATQILSTLKEFPVTYEEIMRKARNNFIKMKIKLENESYKLDTPLHFAEKNSNIKPHQTGKEPITIKTPPVTSTIQHPFHDNEINQKDDFFYCIGNLKLASLSLAYNNLEYPILYQIISVLEYQCNDLPKDYNDQGLVRIVIEGNRIPQDSPNLEILNKILENKLRAL